MDNKRVYKKFSSVFWFLLATFPLWFCFLGAIFTLLSFRGSDIGESVFGSLDLFNRSF